MLRAGCAACTPVSGPRSLTTAISKLGLMHRGHRLWPSTQYLGLHTVRQCVVLVFRLGAQSAQ